jgi:hypothetical protein
MHLAWAALYPAFGEDSRLPRETRQSAEALLERTEADPEAQAKLVREVLAGTTFDGLPSAERLLLVGRLSEDLVAVVHREAADAEGPDVISAHLAVLDAETDCRLAEAAYRLALAGCSTRSECAAAEEGWARLSSREAQDSRPVVSEEVARMLLLQASLEGRPMGLCGSALWRESQWLRDLSAEELARELARGLGSSCPGARDGELHLETVTGEHVHLPAPGADEAHLAEVSAVLEATRAAPPPPAGPVPEVPPELRELQGRKIAQRQTT